MGLRIERGKSDTEIEQLVAPYMREIQKMCCLQVNHLEVPENVLLASEQSRNALQNSRTACTKI